MDINQIYTELIREHSQDTYNKRKIEDKTDSKLGINPSCGDEITINIKIEENFIKDISYEGVGCAISQASTSMMIDLVKGKTKQEARQYINLFLKMIQGDIEDDVELKKLEEAYYLKSIRNLPARVKCAVLAWRTLDSML